MMLQDNIKALFGWGWKSGKIENKEGMEKWERKDFSFPSWYLFGGGTVEGWITFLFNWEEKLENGKYSLYKFIFMQQLDKKENNNYIFIKQLCMNWEFH